LLLFSVGFPAGLVHAAAQPPVTETAVVRVVSAAASADEIRYSMGSGFFVNDIHIVTNEHLVSRPGSSLELFAVFSDRNSLIQAARKGLPGDVIRQAVSILGHREVFVRLMGTTGGNLNRYYRRKALSPVQSEVLLDMLCVFARAITVFGDIGSAGGHRVMAKAVAPVDRFVEKFGSVEPERVLAATHALAGEFLGASSASERRRVAVAGAGAAGDV